MIRVRSKNERRLGRCQQDSQDRLACTQLHSRLGIFLLLSSVLAFWGCRNSDNQDPPRDESALAASDDEVAVKASWQFESHGPSASLPSQKWGHHYRNGQESNERTILESLGGGVAVLDYDRNGICDLLFTGGGSLNGKRVTGLPNQLYRAVEPWEYEAVGDVTGAATSTLYTHGAYVVDFDDDGFDDYLLTGFGGLQLFHNQGDGSFAVVPKSESQLLDPHWSSAAAWGDFNSDGFIDLYVAHYVDWSFDNHPDCPSLSDPNTPDICSPKMFKGIDDTLYLSNGDGTFRDATAESGLVSGGKGLGVVATDLEPDGDLDLYVANDTTRNFLYINDGSGTFEERGELSGVAMDDRGIPNGSMGVDAADYDDDGRIDLWVVNYESEAFALYRQISTAFFNFVSNIQGIRAIESEFVGFGTVLLDADLDGDEDIFVTNGHVILHPTLAPRQQLPLVLENTGTRFERLTWPDSHVLGQPHDGRGLSMADLDNDGDLDLAYSNVNAEPFLLENRTSGKGRGLSLTLVGTKSNRRGIGATVTLVTDQTERLRSNKGGGSYLSSSDSRLFWGITPDETPLRFEILWPSGEQQSFPIAKDQDRIVVIEPGE